MTIDENTPVGLTIFRGIQAVDRDRPNSPNSDIAYSIVAGNEDRKFSLEAGGQKAVVVLRKPLDLEAGDALFNMTILAQVSSSNNLCIFDDLYFKQTIICRMEEYHLSPRPPHWLYESATSMISHLVSLILSIERPSKSLYLVLKLLLPLSSSSR